MYISHIAHGDWYFRGFFFLSSFSFSFFSLFCFFLLFTLFFSLGLFPYFSFHLPLLFWSILLISILCLFFRCFDYSWCSMMLLTCILSTFSFIFGRPTITSFSVYFSPFFFFFFFGCFILSNRGVGFFFFFFCTFTSLMNRYAPLKQKKLPLKRFYFLLRPFEFMPNLLRRTSLIY